MAGKIKITLHIKCFYSVCMCQNKALGERCESVMKKQGGRGNKQVSRAVCISCAFGPDWPSDTSLFTESGYAPLSLTHSVLISHDHVGRSGI